MKRIPKFLLVFLLPIVGCSTPNPKEKSVTMQEQKEITKAIVYETARDTSLRLSPTGEFSFQEFGQPKETQAFVFIDPSVKFQTMVGIGGALTDASAETFAKLPEASQKEFLTAYYDSEKGIGYNFARTNIASCDFSSDIYAYIEENDSTLSTFSIAHDEKYKIPFIKQAIAAANRPVHLFASPWSPPAWMKDNNDVLRGGKLLERYKQAWADHYIKFMEAYVNQGITVWGISVQNEPMAVQRWESCIFTAEEERDFIKKYLGPTLEKSGNQETKLIAWDHNRDLIYQRASIILNDPEAAKYVWGIGYHWYETWTGGDMQFDNVKMVHEAFPDKNLIFTEGCVEKFSLDRVTDWTLGEKYGHSMVNDFNCGTVAWTDWNVLLDETGGPNHVGNLCFAPIHADTKTGKLMYTNSYYYIGHFSKFISEGSQRIACSTNREKLETTAFVNPDGKIVVVVLNTSDDKLPYKLCISGKAADLVSLPHSIMTVLL
jgi:glucosylceramidase